MTMQTIAKRTYRHMNVTESWARQNNLPPWQESGVINVASAREMVDADLAVMATKRTVMVIDGKAFVREELKFKRCGNE